MRLLNKRVLESLIKSDAMDSLGQRGSIDVRTRQGHDRARGKPSAMPNSGSTACLAYSDDEAYAHNDKLPDIPDWDEHTRLAAEKEILGFFITGHPLEKYKDKLEDLRALSTADIAGIKASTGQR